MPKAIFALMNKNGLTITKKSIQPRIEETVQKVSIGIAAVRKQKKKDASAQSISQKMRSRRKRRGNDRHPLWTNNLAKNPKLSVGLNQQNR